MKKIKYIKYILVIIGCLFISSVISHPSLATSFDLIAPTGNLTHGQNVQFTINIDTEGSAITSPQIGLTYDTTALQYVSTAPGTTMSSVSVADQGGGKLLFTGTNTSGFTGQGVFATITFQIIATAPGSTTLCTLWAPSVTPGAPTAPPITALPTTGTVANFNTSLIGVVFLGLAVCAFLIQKNQKFIKAKKTSHHPSKKQS